VTKSDAYTEIYLWNLNLDRLIRVLRRLELQSIRPKQELKAYELRAGGNPRKLECRFLRNDGRA
jgi:hypothetical protein